MSSTTDKIRSRGHWSVTIHPRRFDGERIPFAKLEGILVGAVVRLRGWPVPMIDNRADLMRGEDWIGQDVDAEVVSHYEAWRFFTSGQFDQLRVLSADWRSGKEESKVPMGFESVIEVWEVLFYLTEIFELGARLALSPAGDDPMAIGIELNGLAGRGLIVGQSNRAEFHRPYPAPVEDLRRVVQLPNAELVGNAGGVAVDVALDIFARFGWQPSREELLEHQRELLSYS